MNLRIVLIVLFFYCGQCLSAQNELVRYIKPLDNFNRVEQIIVKNENFLKSLHPDVCEFTIHDNYLYYISANNNSIIRFDIKNGNSKILKNGALERYYSYISSKKVNGDAIFVRKNSVYTYLLTIKSHERLPHRRMK